MAQALTDPSDGRARVVVEAVQPAVDGGRFAAKACVGDTITLSADAFTDGHDHIRVVAEVVPPSGAAPFHVPLHPLGNDAYSGTVVVDAIGRWSFRIVGSVDRLGSWLHGTTAKAAAGQHVEVEMEIGVRMVESAAPGDATAALVAKRLRAATDETAAATLADPELTQALARLERNDHVTVSDQFAIVVDPVLARFSTWYELFPRSASPDPARPGTLTDVEAQLDDLAAMGVDVVYLPPIHPIGRTHRKGHNGATDAGPNEPGSPWGIGAPEGGHDAVHPDLGTVGDVERLVSEARRRGIEIALDIAFQCSPDHPWVTEHPTWFRWRPDGTVQYAENPPKRYQDIYPLDFESPDWWDLWQELDRVFRHWIDCGVTVFRVDNPHTKPFAFWEWCITRLKADHPEVLFLSEAFTRPRVMHRLAKLGFSQSYTYFTWRNGADELRDYLTELTSPPGNRYFRPNLWPNTPDILHEYLQHGGRAAFVTRLVLAGGTTGNYGIYGPPFELCVGTAREPGSEEYLDSDKFQVNHWDLDRPGTLRPLITRLNQARRRHRALQHDHRLTFHDTDHPALLCWSKVSPDGTDRIIGVVNLDPHHARDGHVHLRLYDMDLPDDATFEVEDLLSSDDPSHRHRYLWHGSHNWVRLDPHGTVAHLFAVHLRNGGSAP